MTHGIFISYRRSDSRSDARSICQRLERTFGKRKVFIDVDSIRPGEDYQSVLKNDLEKCNIMLVVIGPRWLELLRSSRPTDNETSQDYVRLEVASALERKLPIFPVLVDGAAMPEAKDLPDDLKPFAFRQAFSVRHDSFPRDMWGLEQELRRSVSTRRTWKVAAVSGLFIFSIGAISYYIWFPLVSAKAYSRFGNFACFNEAQYPDSWREEASFCVPYGCNFGKMDRDACLTLGARKQSKTVIHGNTGTTRANECWLQQSCGDLRSHGEFTMFRM
jgi:TIR domain